MIHALARIKSYLDYGVFQPIQIASIIALRECEEDTKKICAVYQKRRDVLIQGLNRAGWPVEPPKGTMFVWAPLPEQYKHLGSLEFSKMLLEKALVAVSPGIGFGPLGEGLRAFRADRESAPHAPGHRRHQADVAIRRRAEFKAGIEDMAALPDRYAESPPAGALIDLRDLQPEHLAPLLEEEIEAWRRPGLGLPRVGGLGQALRAGAGAEWIRAAGRRRPRRHRRRLLLLRGGRRQGADRRFLRTPVFAYLRRTRIACWRQSSNRCGGRRACAASRRK